MLINYSEILIKYSSTFVKTIIHLLILPTHFRRKAYLDLFLGKRNDKTKPFLKNILIHCGEVRVGISSLRGSESRKMFCHVTAIYSGRPRALRSTTASTKLLWAKMLTIIETNSRPSCLLWREWSFNKLHWIDGNRTHWIRVLGCREPMASRAASAAVENQRRQARWQPALIAAM